MRVTHVWLLALAACPGGGGNPRPIDPPIVQAEGGVAAPEVLSIACGDFHSCALMKDRTVRCWGRNRDGEIGDGTDTDRTRPVLVKGVSGVQELALGANFSCARMSDKTVRCWGSGRLRGDATILDKQPPTAVPGISDIVQLRAGGYMICALDGAGETKCWGLDPKPAAPKGAVELAVAGAHGCSRAADGSVRCWGEGIWGAQTGESFSNPGIVKAKAIATGDSFGCALVETGNVMCWGRNDEGELGVQPDSDNHPSATPVPRISAALAIAAAESHVCALTAGSTVTCWGANDEGELGRGTRTLGEGPQSLVGLRASQIALGADHVCVLTPESAIMCWGSNRNGQLGNGSTERELRPVQVQF